MTTSISSKANIYRIDAQLDETSQNKNQAFADRPK